VSDRTAGEHRGRSAKFRRDRRHLGCESVERARPLVRREQGLYFPTKIAVARTRGIEEFLSGRRLAIQRRREQLLDLAPALGGGAGHPSSSSRLSHARAMVQSRFTVAGEVPNASAVSSTLRPP
jgi:hypothetical protein